MNKFLTEILAQPDSLTSTLEYYSGAEGKKALNNISELIRKEKFQQIIFTGMGSSYFVSYAASCLFNEMGINSSAVNTNELLYYHFPVISEKTLLVCISQSGESVEVVKLLENVSPKLTCIGICNEANSSLSAKSAETLLSIAGKEEMTSTKTYTSISLVAFILGWHLAKKWDNGKLDQVKRMIGEFGKLIEQSRNSSAALFDFLGNVDFLQFIGRGPSFSTAQQSELMFKEAVKISAAGTLAGEFRHGPMEMVSDKFKSVLFAAEGKTYVPSIKMATDIARFKGKVIVITNKDPKLSDPNIKVITINQPDEYLFSILGIVPVQLMVNYLALEKGLEPGNFVHGGKVTFSE